jgi:hypothetical protein
MVREHLLRSFTVVGLVPLAACSLVLDFSDGAIPVDAAPDAPFTQAECDYKEPNNSLAEAQPLDVNEVGRAAICAADPEDHDFYKFTVPAGTASVTVHIAFTNRPSGDLDLKLLDATGSMLAQSRGFTDGETIVCPGTMPSCGMLAEGEYIVEVFPALAGAVNNYEISVTLTPE